MANVNFFSPDGGITRYPLEDTEGRIMYADDIDGINQVEIFHPSQTINGITFTVSNGKIIASGTATDAAVFWCSLIDDHYTIPAGNYHASGCPEQPSNSTQYHIGYLCTRNGSDNVYGNETGNGLDFEVLDGDVDLRVGIAIYSGYAIQGTLVFEPMLTEAKYAGIPYRPYNQQSIQHQINDITGVTGVKNLLENTAVTQIMNGVTFTVNANKSVTVNGTATDNCIFKINGDGVKYNAGSYIATSKEGSGSTNTYFAYIRNMTDLENTNILTAGDTPITISSEKTLRYAIFVASGVTISNKTFYPMIRLATDPDDTYVPKAMTNRELTENAEVITETIKYDGEDFIFSRRGDLVSVYVGVNNPAKAFPQKNTWIQMGTLTKIRSLSHNLYLPLHFIPGTGDVSATIRIHIDGIVDIFPLSTDTSWWEAAATCPIL